MNALATISEARFACGRVTTWPTTYYTLLLNVREKNTER